MCDQPCKTPLIELVRAVPKDLRAEWETQWFEDGTPCGHAMAPVGRYLHELADENERLTAELERRERLTIKMDLENRAENERLRAVYEAAKYATAEWDENWLAGRVSVDCSVAHSNLTKALAAVQGSDE